MQPRQTIPTEIPFWILPEENRSPEGMVVDAATGLVTWTPGDELDGRSVAVTLAVWDGVLWDAPDLSDRCGAASR